MRLDKLLAHAGIASRRHAKQLVRDGRVRVNGAIPESPGAAVDPGADTVLVDGEAVALRKEHVYLALHKPTGYVSTVTDDRGRPTVMDLVPERFGRIYPVGRLDLDSEGLLLLTNHGELTHRLIHPRYHVEKTYHVWVRGNITPDKLDRLRAGVRIEDGVTSPCEVRVLDESRRRVRLEFVLREGRKRQIRRMCHAVECEVTRLKRVRFGPVALGNLPTGQWRALREDEVAALLTLL